MEEEKTTKERSIPNPAYYLGEFLVGEGSERINDKKNENKMYGGPFLALALSLASPFITYDLINNDQLALDTEGTSMEASVMADHREAFSELAKTKVLLDTAISDNEMYSEFGVISAEEKEETRNLLDLFSEQANRAATDLYLKEIVTENTADEKAGAAISEENFKILHSELLELTDGYDTIQGNLGINTEISPGMLDQCIADTTMTQSGESSERYKDMVNLNSCMSNMNNENAIDITDTIISGLSIIPGFLLGIAIFGVGGDALIKLPKRIPLKPKKGRLPSNY